MKNEFEGTYFGKIKYTCYNTNTKKISHEFTNSIYKIHKIDEFDYLVESNNLTKKTNSSWIFFESPEGLTSMSDGIVNKIFYSRDKIITHSWSNQIDSNGIMINGSAELEKACVKCR